MITGVSDEIEQDIRNHIGQPADESAQTRETFLRTIPDGVQRAMRAVGYYSATAEITEPGPAANNPIVIAITAGPPVLISEVDIQISGDAALTASLCRSSDACRFD